MDWIGNVLILAGMYGVTCHKRNAWLVYALGEVFYVVYAYGSSAWGLFSLEFVFIFLCLRGFRNFREV